MKDLLTRLCDCLEKGDPLVLASVIEQQGSTPRGTGAGLIADKNGLIAGTIGGGLLEGQTLEACRAVLQDGKAKILDFALSGEAAAKNAMICGGKMRVLLDPLSGAAEYSEFFRAVRDALDTGEVVLITDITNASHPLRTAYISGACIGSPLPEDAAARLLASLSPAQETSIQVCGKRSYFLERCLPPLRMIIAGGGHISRPTAEIAAMAGFEVTVLDDRQEFSQPGRFPWAARTATVPNYADCFADCAPDARTCIVIVTRGHLHDAAVLSQALATRAGYVGMIGSRRKRGEVYDMLRAQGVGEEDLARVHCPVGIPIDAETPEEIAVSIVAECIAHRRKACSPESMSR